MIAVRFALWLLKKQLSPSERSALSTGILDNLGALPLHDILTISSDGEVLVSGRPIDVEQARSLQDAAKAALNNAAVKMMWEHTAYQATVIGVHEATNEYNILFGRTALWNGQQERKFLNALAGNSHL